MIDPTIAAEGVAPLGLPDWRRRILDRTLLAGALLGPLAYVPSVWLSVREHLWGLVALDTLLYGWVLLLALKPRWPYSLRASSVVAMVLLMALVLGPATGLRETALIWLEFASIVAALFLSRRSAYVVFGASLLALVGISVFMKSAVAPFGSPAWMGWVVTACNAVVIGGTVTLALTVLLRGLEIRISAWCARPRNTGRRRPRYSGWRLNFAVPRAWKCWARWPAESPTT